MQRDIERDIEVKSKRVVNGIRVVTIGNKKAE